MRPYKCPDCEKDYIHKAGLLYHVRSVHEKSEKRRRQVMEEKFRTPHPCPHSDCPYGYFIRRMLTHHLERFHRLSSSTSSEEPSPPVKRRASRPKETPSVEKRAPLIIRFPPTKESGLKVTPIEEWTMIKFEEPSPPPMRFEEPFPTIEFEEPSSPIQFEEPSLPPMGFEEALLAIEFERPSSPMQFEEPSLPPIGFEESLPPFPIQFEEIPLPLFPIQFEETPLPSRNLYFFQ